MDGNLLGSEICGMTLWRIYLETLDERARKFILDSLYYESISAAAAVATATSAATKQPAVMFAAATAIPSSD